MAKMRIQIFFLILFYTLPSFGREENVDKVKVVDGKDYVMYYVKSSIKNLPPDWKKVWVLKNFKPGKADISPKVKSNRTNIVFDCVHKTYYTLSSINYTEYDALSKPALQTASGFNPKESNIDPNSDLMMIFNQVCK